MFADTYTGDIQSEAKKISQTKVYVGQIKRKSFVLNQMNRSVILYTGLLMIRQSTMWTISKLTQKRNMFTWYLVDKIFNTKMSQDMQLLFPQSVVQTVIENQQ